jgi:L-malate glycosyltransferase
MRVLWITNLPFGAACDVAGRHKTGGNWLDAAHKTIISNNSINLAVATFTTHSRTSKHQIKGTTFYFIPGGDNPKRYRLSSSININIWNEILSDFKPDLIHIWGTEYRHGLLALQLKGKVPAIIYMQGVMRQISRHYLSGLPFDIIRKRHIGDLLRRTNLESQQRFIEKDVKYEEEMVKIANNVIVENEWCRNQCLAMNEQCNIYYHLLPVMHSFNTKKWTQPNCEQYTILCNAPSMPLKGIHILLQALALVKNLKPNVKLWIPGVDKFYYEGLKGLFLNTAYQNYIMKLISVNDLNKNIVFLGRLSASDIADRMSKASVFVMASSIENHSSTLIEAMKIGTPVISSFVGGIYEYVKHGENGLLYRFEDYESLKEHIIMLFNNPVLANTLSLNASKTMQISREGNLKFKSLIQIYEKVVDNNLPNFKS